MVFTAEDYQKQKAEKERIQAETKARREAEKIAAIEAAYKKSEALSKRTLYYSPDEQKTIQAAKGYKKFAEERYNIKIEPQQKTANIFGYTQGLSPEQLPEKVTTPQERAATAAETQVIRQTFPKETRFIQGNIQIKKQDNLQKGDKNNTKVPNKYDNGGIGNYTAGQMEKEKVRERRIKTLQKREQRLSDFINAGGYLSPDVSKSSWSIGEIGKLIPRTVLGIAAQPSFIGGRLTFAVSEQFNKEGVKEVGTSPVSFAYWKIKGEKVDLLGRAGKKVPGAVLESFNPTTPEGLINIGMSAFGIKETAATIKAARAPTEIRLAESGTKRISTPELTKDITDVKVVAFQGDKPINVNAKIVGEPGYIQSVEGDFLLGAKGTMKANGKTSMLEIRGTATQTESGGDVFSLTKEIKPKKEKLYLDITKSQTVVEGNDFFTAKTMTASFDTPKNKPITEAKPKSISVGSYGTMNIKDIFTGKNMFVKDIKGDTGSIIATESYLGGSSFELGAKNFKGTFTEPSKINDFLFKKKNFEFEKGKEINIGNSKLVLKQEVQSGVEQNLLSVAKQKAIEVGSNIKTQQILRGSTKSVLSLGAISISKKSQTKQKQSVRIFSEQKQNYRPTLAYKSILDLKPITKPKYKTEQILDTKTITKPVLIETPKMDLPNFTYKNTLSPSTLPPMIPALPTIPKLSGKSKKQFGGFFPESNVYRPSLRGFFAKIKTPKLKKMKLTGLEARGL